jgi:hypothetical protein
MRVVKKKENNNERKHEANQDPAASRSMVYVHVLAA